MWYQYHQKVPRGTRWLSVVLYYCLNEYPVPFEGTVRTPTIVPGPWLCFWIPDLREKDYAIYSMKHISKDPGTVLTTMAAPPPSASSDLCYFLFSIFSKLVDTLSLLLQYCLLLWGIHIYCSQGNTTGLVLSSLVSHVLKYQYLSRPSPLVLTFIFTKLVQALTTSVKHKHFLLFVVCQGGKQGVYTKLGCEKRVKLGCWYPSLLWRHNLHSLCRDKFKVF